MPYPLSKSILNTYIHYIFNLYYITNDKKMHSLLLILKNACIYEVLTKRKIPLVLFNSYLGQGNSHKSLHRLPQRIRPLQ